MMRGCFLLTGVATLLAAAAANGAAPGKKMPVHAPPSAPAAALARNCGAHSFETTIQLPGADGLPKQSKVHMCGTAGQSDADWIKTLQDAVTKTAANPAIPAAAKAQIIAAVNAEVARLNMPPGLRLPTGSDISKLPKAAENSTPAVPLSRDYDALPPLPTASTVPPPRVLGPDSVYGPTLRLTLRCALVGDEDRPTDCDTIEKDTVIVLRADEAFPNGLDVRFVRNGDSRAESRLPAMKPGQVATLRLPAAVCGGVVRSKVEIQAVGANAPSGSPAGKIGEYDLRC
jgi:hypothetical protein